MITCSPDSNEWAHVYVGALNLQDQELDAFFYSMACGRQIIEKLNVGVKIPARKLGPVFPLNKCCCSVQHKRDLKHTRVNGTC